MDSYKLPSEAAAQDLPRVEVAVPQDSDTETYRPNMDLVASLGLQFDPGPRPSVPSSITVDHPTESGLDERWNYPLYESTNLESSSSVRSQRNWNDFDGYPVLPLPSPQIETTEDGSVWIPPSEDSKTDAFFNAPPSLSPRPPQSVSRSASSRTPTAPGGSLRLARGRQRALSSPNEPRERIGANGQPALAPSMAALSVEPKPQPSADLLCVPKLASRHTHGPSVSLTGDSVFPLRPRAPEQVQDEAAKSDSNFGNEILDSFDRAIQEEDETSGTVGPYRILSVLGTGAFSKVVLAEPLQPAIKATPLRGDPSKLVAVKMIACDPCKIEKRMRVSWVREAEILRHVQHPTIVQFVSAFRTPKNYALVLEAVRGGELFDLLRRHKAQVAQREWLVRRIFGELASVVHWMHEHDLVHRDIKLENILLTRTLFTEGATLTPTDLNPVPLIKLTDFGLARVIKKSQLLETRCGSQEYAAPELIMGKMYDGRKTDNWAMGVVLYALLSGMIPFMEAPTDSPQHEKPSLQQKPHEGTEDERDAKDRKAHLLRIAKAELYWPERMNDNGYDAPSDNYDAAYRLLTPQARHIITRFLRRDPNRRANCLELWKDHWFLYGSFAQSTDEHEGSQVPEPFDDATMLCVAHESSAQGQRIALPYSPVDPRGRRWTDRHAHLRSVEQEAVMCHDYT